MNDLISRRAAIKAIDDLPNCYNGYSDTYDKACVIGVLEELPPIDAVPVVRCKDCKHWGIHKSLNIPWCFEMHIDKSEGGYCDSGERREDDA